MCHIWNIHNKCPFDTSSLLTLVAYGYIFNSTSTREGIDMSNAQIQLRIPKELKDKIKEIASNEDRSMNWIINRLLEAGVKEQQKEASHG